MELFFVEELQNKNYQLENPLILPPSVLARHVKGWLLNQHLTITQYESDRGYWLEIPDAGSFWISPGGESINLFRKSSSSELKKQNEALLGPPLVLALSLQGIWCLHASAVEVNGNLVAFLGKSGDGKSTLADFLAQQPGVKLASDDILPIMLLNGSLFASPQFPQLKLPASIQPAQYLPPKLPLSKIYLLKEAPTIATDSLSDSETALTLISHTVAARLFNELLLSKHFEFCSQVSRQVRVQTFAYPRVYSQLPNVVEELLADISKKVV